MMTEGTQPPGVGGHRVIRKVPLHHLTQPCTLLRDRVVPDLRQLLLDTAPRQLQPIPTGRAPKRERAPPSAAADVREPEEVERLRFTKTPLVTPSCRVSTELDQACLVRMHRQPELLHARAYLGQESLGIVLSLETDHAVVGVTNNNHVPAGVAVSPLLRPQVEDVMQVNVGQHRGYNRPLRRPRFGL